MLWLHASGIPESTVTGNNHARDHLLYIYIPKFSLVYLQSLWCCAALSKWTSSSCAEKAKSAFGHVCKLTIVFVTKARILATLSGELRLWKNIIWMGDGQTGCQQNSSVVAGAFFQLQKRQAHSNNQMTPQPPHVSVLSWDMTKIHDCAHDLRHISPNYLKRKEHIRFHFVFIHIFLIWQNHLVFLMWCFSMGIEQC